MSLIQANSGNVLLAERPECNLPYGRRTPRGTERWYLIQIPEGREQSISGLLRSVVPADVLGEVFSLTKECWMKRRGTWFLGQKPAFKGYLVAVSSDPAALAHTLAQLTVPAHLVGAGDQSWTPLADDAAAWYASAMDTRHVLRSSTAHLMDGALVVDRGPLMGQEDRIVQINRHKRSCRVRVSDADGGFVETMPLAAVSAV